MSDAPAKRQPAVVRSFLRAKPAQVWTLFTEGAQLARWFCNACDSDAKLGGYVHAAWLDDDGETWDRVGTWTELSPPSDDNPGCFGTLTWLEGDDSFRFAVAPSGSGSVLTVISPLPNSDVDLREDVLLDAATQGWQRTFELLDELVQTDVG
jgi:hypothetical protein